MITGLLFYLFALVTLFSAVMVISSKNPVHSVLFLILAFFNSGALFVILGAEYLAMTLVIVYVGAVAVLFLFVVMMLNINFVRLREGFLRYLPIGIGIAAILFVELALVLFSSLASQQGYSLPAAPTPPVDKVTNTHAIGNLLYTEYAYLFEVSGLILLVAMIGAIVLTHRARPGVRRQSAAQQVSRTREQSVELVQVKSGSGVDV